MRAFITAVYLFLYAPIALVVLLSFNAGRNASDFTGFSTAWYGKALSNTFLMQALENSLMVAFISAGLAAIYGTMAAMGLERLGKRGRVLFDGLLAAAIVVPQILPAILSGFLLAFTFSFDDFIIAFFVCGSKTTLPIYIFASVRRGVTPEINAIATLVLTASLLLILLSRFLMRDRPRPVPSE